MNASIIFKPLKLTGFLGIILSIAVIVSGIVYGATKTPTVINSEASTLTASYASFGADFYTYTYQGILDTTFNTSNTAKNLHNANENIGKVISMQVKQIKTTSALICSLGGLFLFLSLTLLAITKVFNTLYYERQVKNSAEQDAASDSECPEEVLVEEVEEVKFQEEENESNTIQDDAQEA